MKSWKESCTIWFWLVKDNETSEFIVIDWSVALCFSSLSFLCTRFAYSIVVWPFYIPFLNSTQIEFVNPMTSKKNEKNEEKKWKMKIVENHFQLIWNSVGKFLELICPKYMSIYGHLINMVVHVKGNYPHKKCSALGSAHVELLSHPPILISHPLSHVIWNHWMFGGGFCITIMNHGFWPYPQCIEISPS